MPTKKPVKKPTASKKKQAKKPVASVAVKTAANGARVRKLGKRKDRKRDKTVLRSQQRQKKMIPAWTVLSRSLQHLYRHRKLFTGILLVYALFYILFIKGISANFQLGNLRDNLESTFGGKLSSLTTGVQLFGLLLGTAGTTSTESAGIYQLVLVTITSLALIWALRNTYLDKTTVTVKESFYKSTSQLVPFLIVGSLLIVQLIPALVVASLYSVVQANGLLTGVVEIGVALLVLILGLGWSMYMLSSSLFAMYIVTLPNAKPMESLRAAKALVRFRRWFIIRKIFFLPIALFLFAALVLLPLIIYIPVAAEILFLIFTILLLAVVHSYLYTLYRSLINE